MARRVKKTDSREVDHWVSTDDGRHLPIDKDGNIIFGSSKKSTYKKNLNGTYQRKEKRDGVLVQATVIPGRENGKNFYTIKTGIGDRFKSSNEKYSTLSSAKKAADEMLEGRANLSNGKSQLPNIRSTKTRSYSRGEKVAASVGALGNNRKAARHLKSENRRSMLIEIAENAGVSSSKLQKMDTEDIRAMLLSMLGA